MGCTSSQPPSPPYNPHRGAWILNNYSKTPTYPPPQHISQYANRPLPPLPLLPSQRPRKNHKSNPPYYHTKLLPPLPPPQHASMYIDRPLPPPPLRLGKDKGNEKEQELPELPLNPRLYTSQRDARAWQGRGGEWVIR